MARNRRLPLRQRVRRALLLVSLLLFPLTLYYMSPVLIIMGASEGVVNGSFLVFAGMFVAALFFGRLWCGWACPAGALQELAAPINDRPLRRGKLDWIKWLAIWLPWVGIIAAMAIGAGGYRRVEPLYQLEGGLTLLQPYWYYIYYIVVAVFLLLAVLVGRRAGCHYICWMAPFMILGRKLRNLLRGPALCLRPETERCTSCGTCTRNCPMSLPVQEMVQRGDMKDAECILGGNCADGCPKGVIHYRFGRER